MERVRLHMLGALAVERAGELVVGFESRKALALLCYLALQGQPRTRAHLAELFWPERSEKLSRGNFSRVLHNLTHLLPGCFDVNRQTVGIVLGSAIWHDVAEFERLAAQGDLPALSAAVELYSGDLLADFVLDDCPEFEQWLAATREHLRQRVLQILHRLVEHHYHAGSYADGIAYAERLLAIDAWQEQAHRALMRLLAASGQRNAALAQYETCQRILADELGFEPESATLALYEQIRDGVELLARTVGVPLAPLPATPAALPQRLPRPATSFIGRERTLAQIADLLSRADCRLLTLLGLGGMGKTRLALRAAEMLGPRFSDGVAFVSLEPGSSEAFLLAAIADACNVVFARGPNPSQQLINHLRRRQLLLLLDNSEHLGPGAPTLATLLAQVPGISILATSNERLHIQGEWVLEIEGLDLVDGDAQLPASAIQLFSQRVERARSGQPLTAPELIDAARICRLVAGSPLAIELAAGWARVLTCREIADEVARDLAFLTTSLKDVPERHRSIQAVFEHSWRLLSAAERAVCCRLSVFHGGFDRAAALYVAAATPAILASLVDKLFIHRGTVKQYTLHGLLRRYIQAKLEHDPAEYALAQGRHLDYYSALLQRHAPALAGGARTEVKQQALAEINAEIDNLRASWGWAARQQPIALVEPFVERLALFYHQQSWFAEVVSLLKEALRIHIQQQATIEQPADRLRQVRWERQIGVALYALGRIAESQQHLRRALDLLGQPEPATRLRWLAGLAGQALLQTRHRLWPRGALGRAPPQSRAAAIEAARVLERLTEVYYFNDQPLKTGYAALKALNLSEAYGVSPELARTYANAGIAASVIPLPALADAYCRRALRIAQQIQQPLAHAYILLCSGTVAAGRGRWAAARSALEQAMAIAAACGDLRVWEESLTNLIMVTYHQGELTRQLVLCEQLQVSADRRGDAQVQAWARIERGMSCMVIGPVEAAPALLDEAIALTAGNLGRAEEILLRGLLALAQLRVGEQSRALTTATHVAQLTARAWPTTYFSIHGYASCAEVFLTLWENDRSRPNADQREIERAARQACRALWQCARVFPVARPYAALWEGLLAELAGNAGWARALWLSGLADAERLHMPYLQALLHERIGRLPDLDRQLRQYHQKQAQTLFEQIQARYDSARGRGESFEL